VSAKNKEDAVRSQTIIHILWEFFETTVPTAVKITFRCLRVCILQVFIINMPIFFFLQINVWHEFKR
jgi:hypothetical protein